MILVCCWSKIRPMWRCSEDTIQRSVKPLST